MNPSRKTIACIFNFIRLWDKNEISIRAAALTYTFILGLIPAVAVCLFILSGFVNFHDLQNDFKLFLLKNLAAGTGNTAVAYIDQFLGKVHFNAMGYVGAGALVTTSVLILSSLEHTMNKIWGIHKNRPIRKKIFIYTLLIIFSPLGISLSIMASTLIQKYAPHFFFEATILGFLFNTLFFTFIYKTIPNRKVDWKYALFTGIIIAILSDVAKWGYTVYTAKALFYNKVYGSLAALPFFLIWIYVNWIIFLTGTQLNCVLQNAHDAKEDK